MPEQKSIGWAVEHMKSGGKAQRIGWNGKGMWVQAQFPDSGSKMTLPYLYLKTAQDDLVPWLISQTDAMAEDWIPA